MNKLEYFDRAAEEFAKTIDKEVLWSLIKQGKTDYYHVVIPYTKHNDKTFLWNEMCAWAIETFGMPGDRYTTHFDSTNIEFLFKNHEDAVLTTLRWL